MENETPTFAAFQGAHLIGRGPLTELLEPVKGQFDRGAPKLAIIDDVTGRPLDLDLSGTLEDVQARLAEHPSLAPPPPPVKRGPGRPRLGVVSREVSLLPRHWDWLREQRGGASATLRRLVDEARKRGSAEACTRRAIEAAHRFMWDQAGDQPDFEEAARALFAQDFAGLRERIAAWPWDLREQIERMVARAET